MSLVSFAKIVGELKNVKRTGWLSAGIKNPESVAEHSYRLAVLCMVIGPKFNVNVNKLIKMGLIHDLAESIVGDLVVERGTKKVASASKKFNLEKKAIKNVFANLDDGNNYFKLWQEARRRKSPEAHLLKQLDKIEMALQALEYEGKVESGKLDEFWQNAEKYLKEKDLISLYKSLLKKRKEMNSRSSKL